jgi:hypothetical protein
MWIDEARHNNVPSSIQRRLVRICAAQIITDADCSDFSTSAQHSPIFDDIKDTQVAPSLRFGG